MTITRVEPHFVYFKANDRLAYKLGATFLKSTQEWRVPKTLGSLRELWKEGLPIEVYGKAKRNQHERALQDKEGNAELMKRMSEKLRPYQKQDASFLLQRNNLASFSEMRTGKSPTLCEVLQQRHKKTIIVCPSSLVLNWREELLNWTDADVFIGKGTPKKREEVYLDFHMATDFSVLILSKDMVRMDALKIQTMSFEVMLVDEAHFLRNHRSKQSQAIFTLGKNADFRYALTGTPATNSPIDVYGILKYLEPDAYPSYWQFAERYFELDDSGFGKTIGGFKNKERKKEFHEVISSLSVQRKRVEVMKWLPPVQYQTIPLEMSKQQRNAYESMLDTFEVDDVSASTVLAQLTRLRQITLAPSILKIDAPSVKRDFLLEWLEDNPTSQVVIFSNFSSYLRELKKEIPNSALITGEEDTSKRYDTVTRFQRGNIRVILANIEAGGTGLTLDNADAVIFLDRSYNPSSNAQAESRIIPTTEDSNMSCLVLDLVCEDSVDERIIDMVKKKQSITQIVNNYKNVKEFLK